jgi:hypothetical protein
VATVAYLAAALCRLTKRNSPARSGGEAVMLGLPELVNPLIEIELILARTNYY